MKYTDILNLWIEEKKLCVRFSTYSNYLCLINSHFASYFKNMEIKDITQNAVRCFILQISKQMRPSSCLNIQKILRQSLEYAVDNNFITENPYKKIKLSSRKKELNVFSKEEMYKILNADKYKNTKYCYIVNIAYRTGMRIGEIMTLKWSDIDFDNCFLSVKRTYSRYQDSKPLIVEPKSKSAKRRIDLDKVCMEIFRSIERRGNFVFANNKGNMLSHTIISVNFKKMCEAANVPYRNFHVLRHTHASILLATGVHPKIVQERLGHAKISITMDIYSHLTETIQKDAIKVLNKL